MKSVAAVFALVLSQAAAFQLVPRQASGPSTRLNAEYEPMDGEGKINLKIDLDSPKVATMVRLSRFQSTYSAKPTVSHLAPRST
jgi:hypothetical protein